MSQYASTLIPGKTYKLRLWTKEELRARVTGETGDAYLLLPMDKSSLGAPYEQTAVDKRHVKLLEEIP